MPVVAGGSLRAIQVETHGNSAEVLKVVDLPDVGPPAAGEVVVEGARRILRPVTIPPTATRQERPIMANRNPGGGAAPLYLEDLRVGQRFVSGTHRLDEEQIRVFAGQFDPQPFHLDAEAAKATLFEGLVASGWHTAAITMRLLVESGLLIAGGIIGAGGEITWPNPTRPGDVLQVESEVLECRPSRSRPDRGIATIRSETRNQRGDTVQVLVAKLVVPRSAQSASPGPAPSR